MNVMLVAVAVISLFINQVSVGILVGALVVLNVILGARQELKAKASVDALAKMQIPQARVVREGLVVSRAAFRDADGRAAERRHAFGLGDGVQLRRVARLRV